MISAGYRWPLYDTSPTLIPLRRIDSEIIHFGRTNHQPDNAPQAAGATELQSLLPYLSEKVPTPDADDSSPTHVRSGILGSPIREPK
jgi:hypothetical protein